MQVRYQKFFSAGKEELGHFDKHFVKNTGKSDPAVKDFGFFSPRYSSSYILNRKINPKMDTIKVYFSKIRSPFSILKNGKGDLLSPLLPIYASVSVAEYASTSLNMAEYPWKCLNELFVRLLKVFWVLNMPWFWIWHGWVFKDYAEFWICLIMAPYPSKTPKYASTCLNVPKYTWINCSDYA